VEAITQGMTDVKMGTSDAYLQQRLTNARRFFPCTTFSESHARADPRKCKKTPRANIHSGERWSSQSRKGSIYRVL